MDPINKIRPQGRMQCSATGYLKNVSNVDNKSALQRPHRNPGTILALYLQTLDLVHLQDQGEEISVRVWGEAHNLFCLGAGRIVVDPHRLHSATAASASNHLRWQPEVAGHNSQKAIRYSLHGSRICVQCRPVYIYSLD